MFVGTVLGVFCEAVQGKIHIRHFPIPPTACWEMLYSLKILVEVAPKSCYFEPRRSALPGTMSVRSTAARAANFRS